jgi:DNA-binding response OmpR family regulator
MESLLLIGSDNSSLKAFKGYLVKKGFQVTACDGSDLASIQDSKERFLLGIVDATNAGRVADLMAQIRSKLAAKELPFLVMVQEPHLRELTFVSGLEDFLVTPVAPELLETKVRFLLKRLNHLSPGSGIQIGKLKVDVDRYEVSLNGELLELTYKEFELLKFLATHTGRVFSRDQLLNQVWGYDFIGGTRTVDVHVRRLRAKLGPKYASLIATVRNVGYKFLESL